MLIGLIPVNRFLAWEKVLPTRKTSPFVARETTDGWKWEEKENHSKEPKHKQMINYRKAMASGLITTVVSRCRWSGELWKPSTVSLAIAAIASMGKGGGHCCQQSRGTRSGEPPSIESWSLAVKLLSECGQFVRRRFPLRTRTCRASRRRTRHGASACPASRLVGSCPCADARGRSWPPGFRSRRRAPAERPQR